MTNPIVNAAIITILLCVFFWCIYLQSRDSITRSLRIITWFILISIGLLFGWFSIACPGDRTVKHYGRDGSSTGYSKLEGNRESHFDKSGNRTGFSIHRRNKTDNFDLKWNRLGRDDFDETQTDELGVIK